MTSEELGGFDVRSPSFFFFLALPLSSFEIWFSVQCAWHASGVISLCCCVLHA